MSELGSLSECMVDSDEGTKTRARRLLRKALAASIAFEAVVVAGLILWPLVTLGVLPAELTVTPVPPYHGDERPRVVQHHNEHPGSTRQTNGVRQAFQPPRIPTHTSMDPDPEAPRLGLGEPTGPGISIGFDDGGPIPIERPRPQPPNRPVLRSGEVMNALLIHRVEPEYPQPAKWIHLAGTVVLRARIGTDGEVHELETVSGNPLLAQAARTAVLQWRYRPTMLHGQAVEVETQITVNFVMNAN
jgi:periplasmic protein TonB